MTKNLEQLLLLLGHTWNIANWLASIGMTIKGERYCETLKRHGSRI